MLNLCSLSCPTWVSLKTRDPGRSKYEFHFPWISSFSLHFMPQHAFFYGCRNIYYVSLSVHFSSDLHNPLRALLLGHLYCGWCRNCSLLQLRPLLPLWVTRDKSPKQLNCKARLGYFILQNGLKDFWKKARQGQKPDAWMKQVALYLSFIMRGWETNNIKLCLSVF